MGWKSQGGEIPWVGNPMGGKSVGNPMGWKSHGISSPLRGNPMEISENPLDFHPIAWKSSWVDTPWGGNPMGCKSHGTKSGELKLP